jgi:hypothetical protein
MEGRDPKPDAYRNNVGPGDCRRCRVSLILQVVASMFSSAITIPTEGMPEGRASSRMIWALCEQSVTLCAAFLN